MRTLLVLVAVTLAACSTREVVDADTGLSYEADVVSVAGQCGGSPELVALILDDSGAGVATWTDGDKGPSRVDVLSVTSHVDWAGSDLTIGKVTLGPGGTSWTADDVTIADGQRILLNWTSTSGARCQQVVQLF